MPGLTLGPVLAGSCRVLDAQGRQVGNLKLISGRWKFKAIGHDEQGQLIPCFAILALRAAQSQRAEGVTPHMSYWSTPLLTGEPSYDAYLPSLATS